MKIRSRAVLCIIVVATGGCGAGVKMAQESEHGGIVVYPYKSEQGPVLSSFRKDAVHMMEERCPSGHTIIREGETKVYIIQIIRHLEGRQIDCAAMT